jgi:hypothetical protein
MPIETLARYGEIQERESRTTGLDNPTERRRRPRLRLRLPVYFFREGGQEPLPATTLNISSEGFYCLSNVAFKLGQVLGCLLVVPTHDPDARERKTGLDCRVRVVRVSNLEIDHLFGVACQIEDYHFLQQ